MSNNVMQLARDHTAIQFEQSSNADLPGYLFLITILVLRGFLGSMLSFLNLFHRQICVAGWPGRITCM